ncbi:MAG TPA: ATP-binding protein [Thermoanaerobaculia bacterium]|jgi:signal transduction histidine kinase
MNRIRWKLLVAMIAVVSVTLGLSALFTREFTLEEVRRLVVAQGGPPDVRPLDDHYRAHGSWNGVEAALDQVRARVVLATGERRVIAVSRQLRAMSIELGADDRLVITGRGTRIVVQLPAVPVGDAFAYVLPEREPMQSVAALDRRLVLTFVTATLVAIGLAYLVSRRITGPMERLTAAVDSTARGAEPAHVPVSGGDEVARLARSFNAMADALSRQRELRRRMVVDVAHELRTPLTNLRCELEAIQDGLAAPDSSRIASLLDEVLHLQHVVGDLQELALADAGGLQLRRERIELGATVARIVDACAASRRVELEVEAVHVLADPVRIGQIVRNLLDNALRHARSAIHVRVARGESEAIVSVADDGEGIPADELAAVFERFYRVDDARERAAGGAGLGLAIVKQLVEAHGGRVWAENAPCGGAVITLALPS